MRQQDLRLGIYEKALPHDLSWSERLAMAKRLGFDFVEMSIDETDERLARLDWDLSQRMQFVSDTLHSGLSVPTMCLSGHRRFPLGSKDPSVRRHALSIMEKAIKLALDVGIRVIQIAGYDEYYQSSDEETDRLFRQSFAQCERMARTYQVPLSFEIMDTAYLNSIDTFLALKREFTSSWIGVYPDVGNLSAWGNDLDRQLREGHDWISAIHLKDTIAVTDDHPGVFKEVPFGTGCVDFTGVFRTLRDIGYTGPLVIEMWTGKERDPQHAIASARSFMLDHMREARFLED